MDQGQQRGATLGTKTKPLYWRAARLVYLQVHKQELKEGKDNALKQQKV